MDYILHLIIILCLTGILTMSLNYVAGFGGIMSVSHLSFYGIGAYSTAILMINYQLPFLFALLLSILLTAAIAYLASFPILKLKDDSLVLVSLGFTIIAFSVMLNWQSLTNGPLGLSQIPAAEILGFKLSITNKFGFLILALCGLLLTAFVLWWITKSIYGIIMKSIREEETKAMAVGHHAMAYKRSIFIFSALFAGFAGGLFATYSSIIEPKTFELLPSFILLIMVILGGMGSLKGAMLGALFLVLTPELLRFLEKFFLIFDISLNVTAEVEQIIYGALVVILMFLRPQGLLGKYRL